MFATMRRKYRSARMKRELGQSVDHFKRAATIAAHETSSTVGPKITAARERVQPTAVKAKDAATQSWDSAIATLTPLVVTAAENARQVTWPAVEAGLNTTKAGRKKAKQLKRRARGRRRSGLRLAGLLLAGAAVGAAGAYVVRMRRREQWDEYDPAGPLPTPVAGADDAAFEPELSGPTGLVTPTDETDSLVVDEGIDQTSSTQHSPTVARMASGKNKS
ncbi:hypothetical protein ACIBSW_35950 [Actinoplanes sp. NPDC049668]|uniref:hypothetical protein n=1 Tax=unclassified Actinoplanes TaxID=2626549 RepID=UPI0033BB79A0